MKIPMYAVTITNYSNVKHILALTPNHSKAKEIHDNLATQYNPNLMDIEKMDDFDTENGVISCINATIV